MSAALSQHMAGSPASRALGEPRWEKRGDGGAPRSSVREQSLPDIAEGLEGRRQVGCLRIIEDGLLCEHDLAV